MTELHDQLGPLCVTICGVFFYSWQLNSAVETFNGDGEWIKHAARTWSEKCQSWSFAAILEE